MVAVALTPGDEHSRQRDVLELVEVVQIVFNGHALAASPVQRFSQSVVGNPGPRFQRSDGPDIWDDAPDIQPFGLVEQAEGTLQVTLGLP
jgi:hypothetical protein